MSDDIPLGQHLDYWLNPRTLYVRYRAWRWVRCQTAAWRHERAVRAAEAKALAALSVDPDQQGT